MFSPLTSLGLTVPVKVIVVDASSRPRSIDPESPMKTRAGLKLCGKKPRQIPISEAATMPDVVARSRLSSMPCTASPKPLSWKAPI